MRVEAVPGGVEPQGPGQGCPQRLASGLLQLALVTNVVVLIAARRGVHPEHAASDRINRGTFRVAEENRVHEK